MVNQGWKHLTVGFIILNVSCVAIGVATIFLNVFVMRTILSKPRQWNITLTFLVNLAIADTLTGVFVIYNVVYNCLDYNVFLECAFRSGCACGIMGSSAMIIVGLGFERYVKIVTPLRYMTVVSSTNVKGYLVLVWTMASILAFSPFLSWLSKPNPVTYCDFFTVLQEQYLYVVCSILFILLAFMGFMYGHILLIASSKSRSEELIVLRPRLDSTNQRLVNSSTWWKPTKVVLLIVGVNFITLLPAGQYMYISRFQLYKSKATLYHISPARLIN